MSATSKGTPRTPFCSSYSLRARYLVVTMLATIAIIASALFAQHYVERSGETRSKNLQMRNAATTHIRQMRNAVLQTEKSLDAFLWQSEQTQRQRVYQSLDTVFTSLRHIKSQEWVTTRNLKGELEDTELELKTLQSSIEELMESRVNPVLRDPYLAIHSESFQPATRNFNNAVTAILLQTESGDHTLHAVAERLHKPLEELRKEWMQLDILAESYGGLSEKSHDETLAEFTALELRQQQLIASLQKLSVHLDPLPGSHPLRKEWRRVQTSTVKWHNGFTQLRLLLEKGHRRGDLHFLVTQIEPQLSHIWGHIQRLEDSLDELANRDVTELAESATTIARVLWLLAFIGLALLIAGLIYFECSVLSPIVMVAKALRNEARGIISAPLPEAQSRETHHLIDAFSQMREQVQQRQQSLEYLALHDTLTGLANREQLVRTIEEELAHLSLHSSDIAVLVITLDRFREINISLGHTVGDQLLKAIGERLANGELQQRLVAKLGGDEFAVLLCDEAAHAAQAVAQKVIDLLQIPFEVAEQSLFIRASVGIALAPEHGSHALELLQKAGVAAHVAKRHKSSIVYYGTEHDRHALRRLGLANALRLALDGVESGLTVAYQPQIDIASGKMSGVEALLRWRHPQEGDVGPDELIPIAEHTGLIHQLTLWVMERAFCEFSQWKKVANQTPRLAVNLSVFNLYDADFPQQLQQMMARWEMPSERLQLEITESAMMADPALAQHTLEQIAAMGIELVIDDYGTGFSSLSYLKHLPVSKLKIDKSFVMSMLSNDNDAVIIRSTIDLAHNLGLQVVAEGVESSDALALLDILDCDTAQGFHIAPPLEFGSLVIWAEDYALANRYARDSLRILPGAQLPPVKEPCT